MAIVYCLGFERAVGPNINVPLPYVMRERIQIGRDGEAYERVLQSYVMVEISNARGEVLCVRRDVEGGADKNSYKHGEGKR